MIPRYSRPEMVAIWEPQARFRIWFEIEAHACDAQADLGVIPRENAEAVWKAKDVEFDVARIDEIERVTKHDVIAFLTHLAEHIGADEARFVHQGMTSSDVLDTTLNVQLVRAADILLADMDRVLAALKKRAYEHKDTVRIGRSHGIHAEPTTMGLTFARFYAEMARGKARLLAARDEVATGAISGAVGTFANIDPRVEEYVCKMMGLRPEPISTQVIPRDRHAMFFATLGVIASSMEAQLHDKRLASVTITDVRVTNDLQIAKVYWTQLGHDGREQGERKRAKQALDQAKGRLRSLVGSKAGLRLTPQLQFIYDEVPSEAHEIEDILAVAHKRDEEIAKARETAQYAGDADPYKHPEERDDDEFDDDDEYDEYADDLDDDDVEGNGIGVETLEDDAENATDEATGDR